MIRGEWRSIFHSKILWISVAVMILIPFLYSVFFLTSVWDPYGDTKNLPVAVVNEDKPVNYQGKRLAVGEEMVKNIKKNDQLGWHFVSADEAQAGLANHKYYTVVTIPANFSKHATTVTSKHPQKMKLHYSTNASLNYIAKVISDAGATQLNQNVRASVTKAYALAMFKQVKTAGKGFSKAADGSKKLAKGGKTLKAGLVTYTNGVADVDNGLKTLNGSTGELASGVSQLADGSGQVTTGLNTMNNSTGALASGVSQLNTGAKALNVGVVQYTDGVYELRSGLQQLDGSVVLRSKVNQLEKGADDTAAGSVQYTGYVAALAKGNKDLNDKVQPIGEQVPTLTSSVDTLTNGSKSLVQKMTELQKGSQKITNGVYDLHTGIESTQGERQKVTQGMSAMNDKLTELAQQLEALPNSESQAKLTALMTDMQKQATQLATSSSNTTSVTDQINSKIDGLKDSQNLSDAQVSALKDSLASVGQTQDSADAATKANAAKSLSTDMQALAQALSAMSSSTPTGSPQDLVKQFGDLKNGVDQLSDSVDTINASIETVGSSTQGLTDTIALLNKQGAMELSGGLMQFQGELPVITAQLGQLTAGTQQLADSSAQIAAGSSTLNGGTSQVSTGIKALDSVLSGSIGQLYQGSSQLTAKSPELKSGASQLAAGTTQLNEQVPTLVSGVSQLFNGSKQVTGGLQTLNGKVPALVTGVQKLTDGADQLNENSPQLLSGIKQIKDGNGTLAKSLQSGADTVNATPLKNSNAQMFATPSKLTHSNYSYVPNYGHALAPYVLSLALYVGAIVFNFAYPIRRMSDDDGTPTQWFLSKVAVGAPVAVLMAIIECVALLIVGLKPISMAGYFTTAIMIALASMFIVMFLSMLFDNPGRFVAMVLLMLQLGGSGGTFPMEITNHFFNVIHPFLPLTYSILAFRQSLTGGWGNETFVSSIVILAIFAIVSLILLWASMVFLKQHNMQELAEEPIKMKAGK